MNRCWLVVIALVGCKYSPPGNPANGDGSIDMPSPDAGPCQALGLTCLDENTLLDCETINELPTEKECGWGCDPRGTATGAACKQVVPSGGAVTTADLDPTTLTNPNAQTLGAATIDTTDPDPIITPAAGAIAFDVRVSATTPKVAIFRFASLHITGPITVQGENAVALVADGPIVIDAVIDLHGCSALQGASPGGYDGGSSAQPGVGSTGTGSANGGGDVAGNTKGGGGGGFGGNGGQGGNAGGAGGIAYGMPTILKLEGGGGGGGGRGGGGGVGGGGGGAIQLVSNTSITINTNGGIDAGGCGGEGGGVGGNDSGGGGGAGGAILLEGPTITIQGGLGVNGGGGGGSGGQGGATTVGGNGGNGTLDRDGGTGGTAGMGDTNGAIGGVGGAAMTANGALGGMSTLSAGGGGAIGRIRFNTLTGMRDVPNGVTIMDPLKVSPNLDDATTCTQGAATLLN